MKLSPGKRKRLESVSDSRGVIAALAIDQRDALRKLFSAELKIEKHTVPREQLAPGCCSDSLDASILVSGMISFIEMILVLLLMYNTWATDERLVKPRRKTDG